jgi:serine/threonine protein kinase
MEDDELAICMEYCEGGSMEAVYRRVAEKGQTISENILGKISEAVLNGLVYLHKMHHVIHRGEAQRRIAIAGQCG